MCYICYQKQPGGGRFRLGKSCSGWGVCSSILETALAWLWELRLAVQLLLVGEYCLGLSQVWVDTDLSHLKHSLGVSSMANQSKNLRDEWEVKHIGEGFVEHSSSM